MVAEVPEQLVVAEPSGGESVGPTGVALSDSAVVTSVVKGMSGAGIARTENARAERSSMVFRSEGAEVVDVCDSEDEGKVEGD
jgi:hypothetical protein